MSTAMTKEEFSRRWNKDDQGDGITFNEIADCAVAWGLFPTPRIHSIHKVRDAVVQAALKEETK